MDRRIFLKTSGVAALFSGIGADSVQAFVPAHNWEKYDFGSGPEVKDRLYQGPFPQYMPEQVVPGSHVVTSTMPSDRVLNNYGMGMTTYVCDEHGHPNRTGKDLENHIHELVKLDLGQKLYLRCDWRDIQQKPGRLDFADFWKIAFDLASEYKKRIGIRIQLASPVIEPQSVPDFLAEKIPFVELGTTDKIGLPGKVHAMPRYDHPEFLKAFKEMDDLLSDIYNGHPLIEFVDTCMYGFWGEGHSWPFQGNPFPDNVTAEKTFVEMFNHQLQNWTETPLMTNTQPDFSQVGNAEILDRTIRSNNWIRTDTIFIENRQIEALSNRPPWIAAFIEKSMADVDNPRRMRMRNGIPITDRVISHVIDAGANYHSLWYHNVDATRIKKYYNSYPGMIDKISRCIGYRIRPSWIWQFEREDHQGLVFGMVNDGIASVPGILRLTVFSEDESVKESGCLDPGYPNTSGVRQAMILLPKGVDWKGLRVKAEVEVKNKTYPLEWSCEEEIHEDGSFTLQPGV
jgi:hypothetical protein